MHRPNAASCLAALAALAACSRALPPATEDPAQVDLVASVQQAAQVPPVAAVWVHLHGTTARGVAFDVWEQAVPSGGQWTVSFARIPIGAYLVGARAYVDPAAPWSADPDYLSTADVAVALAKNDRKQVALVLQQNVAKWPPETVHNQAPRVDSLVASAPVLDSSDPPDALSLVATASDPDGAADLRSFAWEATLAPPAASAGAFSAPSALATTWTPPVGYEGTAVLAFTVADQRDARSSVSIAVQVGPGFGRGDLAVAVRINGAPDITALTATNAQPLPGGAATFAATASDADGDPLYYAWSDDCGGTFAAPAAATTDWVAPGAEGPCTLRVTVADWDAATPAELRGPAPTATLVVNVRGPITRFAPQFGAAYQQPSSPVAPLSTVFFRVEVAEPVGDPPVLVPVTALEWSDGRGGTFTPVAGSPAEVRWTAPGCAELAPPYTLPVTVTATGSSADPYGNPNTSVFTFPFALLCP